MARRVTTRSRVPSAHCHAPDTRSRSSKVQLLAILQNNQASRSKSTLTAIYGKRLRVAIVCEYLEPTRIPMPPSSIAHVAGSGTTVMENVPGDFAS